MKTLADRVLFLMEEMRPQIGQSELARRVGKSQQAISDVLTGKIKQPRFIVQLAKALNTTPEWLESGEGTGGEGVFRENLGPFNAASAGAKPRRAKLISRDEEIQQLAREHTAFGPEMVPCYGDVNAAGDAIVITEGAEIGQVPVHPDQRGAAKAWAMRVNGDCMFPMYREGQIVYLVGKLPPRKGDGVVIEMIEGEGYLKEFVRRSEKEIICKQYNPEKERRFPLDQVKAVHTVVGTKRM